jgi:hypothetical protein
VRLQAIAVLTVLSVLLAADASFGYYNQSLGRWTSEDPLGTDPAGGGHGNQLSLYIQYRDGDDLYEYARSTPTGHVDTDGLTTVQGYTMYGKQFPWLYHVGFLIDGKIYDFGPGPNANVWLWEPGVAPYGTGPTAGTPPDSNNIVIRDMVLKTTGEMGEGPNKGKKCACLTLRNAATCVKYMAVKWNGTRFHATQRNCTHFKHDATAACCLKYSWE